MQSSGLLFSPALHNSRSLYISLSSNLRCTIHSTKAFVSQQPSEHVWQWRKYTATPSQQSVSWLLFSHDGLCIILYMCVSMCSCLVCQCILRILQGSLCIWLCSVDQNRRHLVFVYGPDLIFFFRVCLLCAALCIYGSIYSTVCMIVSVWYKRNN